MTHERDLVDLARIRELEERLRETRSLVSKALGEGHGIAQPAAYVRRMERSLRKVLAVTA